MRETSIILQLVIAAGIVNVWILRFSRPTPWRPDGAANMAEEFARYGFPAWMRRSIGAAKLTLAALLIVGIWYEPLAVASGAAMALLMLGALAAHVRIADPLRKSLPAFSLFLSSVLVVLLRSGATWA